MLLTYGLAILYFFIQNAYADKTVFEKKGYRKSQPSGILTEPLNPRYTYKIHGVSNIYIYTIHRTVIKKDVVIFSNCKQMAKSRALFKILMYLILLTWIDVFKQARLYIFLY